MLAQNRSDTETKKQGKVLAGMTMSLDGFINERNGSLDSLYPDLDELRKTRVLQKIIENTGAVVIGKNAYSMGGDPDWYADNYEFQVPIFVLTHNPPKKHPKETDRLKFTYVTDGIESAIQKAKEAAGDKDVVVVGGASTTQQCIIARLFDELHVEIMPVLLCGKGGLRFFEHLGGEKIQLEKIDTKEYLTRTLIRFRLAKTATKRDIVVTRVFDAPVEQVWKAWSDSDQVMRWWGPRGFTSPLAKMDFREGGTSLVCMHSPDGQDMYNTWQYRKIVPLQLIDFIQNFSDKDGKKTNPADHGLPPDFPQDVRSTVVFKSLDKNKTEMTVTEYSYTSNVQFDLSKAGLEECLDKMAESFRKD